MSAYYIDSLGNVSKLTINHSDSVTHCYKLVTYQFDSVKLYVDSLFEFQAPAEENLFLNCADCPIENIVLTKKGVRKSYNSKKAFVPSAFYGLAAIVESKSFNSLPCKDFNFLFQSSRGYEDLFVKSNWESSQ